MLASPANSNIHYADQNRNINNSFPIQQMQNPFTAHNQVQMGQNLNGSMPLGRKISYQKTFEIQSDVPLKNKTNFSK
jgi:hypothetical protein